MPAYDYKCRGCGHVWEVRLPSAADDPEQCPNCDGKTFERLFPAPFVAKGRSSPPGTTCCGRPERCETPPCSTGNSCCKE
ncbi:MAG TPA: zinc ribbon domain-containing protein [Desulfotomaculum sp.]|nr:zinc ribbon domain-containing protein [Desulfotomaculum sp.]